MVNTGNECQLTYNMLSCGEKCSCSLLRGSVVPAKVLLVLLNTLLVRDETSNALVVVLVGNGAHCVSREVTLHIIPRQPSASVKEKSACASSWC